MSNNKKNWANETEMTNKNYLNFQSFENKKTKLRANAPEWFPSTDEEYEFLVGEYADIFLKVCELRLHEENLVLKAKNKYNSLIQNNPKEIAEFNAYQDLRNYKNSKAVNKIQLYTDLDELSKRIKKIFKGNKKDEEKFKNKLSKSTLFNDFIRNNPKCSNVLTGKKYGQTYKGLENYLKQSKKRYTVVMAERKSREELLNNIKNKYNKNFPPLKGGYKKRKVVKKSVKKSNGTEWSRFLKKHKGSGKSMTTLSKLYKKEQKKKNNKKKSKK